MSGKSKPQIGQIFNPFKRFTGLFIPEALARCAWISPGAKLVYGRLARYAGLNSNCHPSVAKLAAEVGLKKRQVQTHLANLENTKLIRRIPRKLGSRQTSNDYRFIWHALFEGVQDPAPGGMQDTAREGVQDPAHKESQTEESHIEEKVLDLDCLPPIAKTSDSRQESICMKHPRLREALSNYMIAADDPERVYPSDRLVVDVMDAAGGASEEDVVRCLSYLKNDRGLLPGTRNGPRRFSWFKSVVADHFQQKRNREAVFVLSNGSQQRDCVGLSKAEFDAMTEAIEID